MEVIFDILYIVTVLLLFLGLVRLVIESRRPLRYTQDQTHAVLGKKLL